MLKLADYIPYPLTNPHLGIVVIIKVFSLKRSHSDDEVEEFYNKSIAMGNIGYGETMREKSG